MTSRCGRSFRDGTRLGGIAVLLATALVGPGAGPASADTIVPLPDGHIVRQLGDGTVITMAVVGESANINPRWVIRRSTATCGSPPAARSM